METEFKQVYDKISNLSLIELLLPEDKNFIEQTKIFQEQIKSLDKMLEINEKHIKNIYFLSSEMIQAVIHNGIFEKEIFTNCVKLFYSDNRFYLLSQNLVHNDKIGRIKMKFDEVNSAFDMANSQEELMLRYKYKLKNTPLAKAGISVGVLDLARRTLNKLLYNFEKVDEQHSIFSIICTINND
jgi:hypothetical protein